MFNLNLNHNNLYNQIINYQITKLNIIQINNSNLNLVLHKMIFLLLKNFKKLNLKINLNEMIAENYHLKPKKEKIFNKI